MKKTAIIAGAVFFLFTAVANAQTDSTVPVQPEKAKTDQWNNHDPAKYKLQPMPEALTTDKIFPVVGKYSITDKDGAASEASITLDESNKGIVWVEGLPQGRFKAYLRKTGVYKIPVQTLNEGEVVVENEAVTKTSKAKVSKTKELQEGVLIFDKDNNTLNVCIGCAYNVEDPAVAFAEPATVETEAVVTETKVKKGTVKTKTKVKPVQTWKYSGNKVIETTASVPAQTQQ